jgi:glycosyltransferase involved in cell wall biosynthesis
MYDKGLVSIIVPCYNGEKYICRFFDSLLLQTYKKIEIIIINDGSIDNSETLILKYKTKFEDMGSKYVYIHKENGGLGSAIQTGLLKVTGEYFCWFNIDDILCSNAIEVMVGFLNTNMSYGLVRPNVYMTTEENPLKVKSLINDSNPEKDKENLFENALFQKNFTFGASMLRTEWFDKINKTRYIYESREGQNWQILLPMFYYYKSGYIDEPLYYVVQQKNSTSNVHGYEKKIKQMLEYEKIILETLKFMKIPEENIFVKQIREIYEHRIFSWANGQQDYPVLAQTVKSMKEIKCLRKEEKKAYAKRFFRIEYWMYIKRCFRRK